MSTLRDTILAAQDLKTESIEIAEWGVTLTVRTLNVRQRGEIEAVLASCKDANGRLQDTGRFYAALVVAGVVDDGGQPVFSKSDRDALMAKAGDAVGRIAEAVARLAGLNPQQPVVDAKNSESDPIDASAST